jgi:hypothetical protein
LSIGTALAIKSMFTDFQSNAKLKEAGIQLQKKTRTTPKVTVKEVIVPP